MKPQPYQITYTMPASDGQPINGHLLLTRAAKPSVDSIRRRIVRCFERTSTPVSADSIQVLSVELAQKS